MDKEIIKGKIVEVLSHHIGQEHACDMGALFHLVFEQPWKNKINDTGQLRCMIRELRSAGTPIGSCSDGFFLIRSDSELKEYCDRQERRALGTLKRISRIKKISLPQLLGQLQLQVNQNDAQ